MYKDPAELSEQIVRTIKTISKDLSKIDQDDLTENVKDLLNRLKELNAESAKIALKLNKELK